VAVSEAVSWTTCTRVLSVTKCTAASVNSSFTSRTAVLVFDSSTCSARYSVTVVSRSFKSVQVLSQSSDV